MKKISLYISGVILIFLVLSSCKKTNAPQFTTVNDYDGNIYRVYKIGTQYWMLGNLETTHYADGTPLINGCKHPLSVTDTTGAYYYWQDCDTSYTYDFGLYYTWAGIMRGASSSNASPSGIQGPCPNGFHVPSDAEWQTLISYLGGSTVAGGLMKGFAYWESGENGYAYQNTSNFNALPGGYMMSTGLWGYRDYYAYFWSTTLHDSANVNMIFLTASSTAAIDSAISIHSGLSCRCLQN